MLKRVLRMLKRKQSSQNCYLKNERDDEDKVERKEWWLARLSFHLCSVKRAIMAYMWPLS